MSTKRIDDVTEAEFLSLVEALFRCDYPTEAAYHSAIFDFEELSEHPDGADLIFYPKGMRNDTPEGVVEKVKLWRAENRKPGFKSE